MAGQSKLESGGSSWTKLAASELKEPLEFVQNMRPEWKEMRLVVAGGAVRDTLRRQERRDIDIYAMGWKREDLMRLLTAMRPPMFLYGDSPPNTHYPTEFRPVSAFRNPKFGLVQIMASNTNSLEELLRGFDWNICQWAYDGELCWYIDSESGLVHAGGELQLRCARRPLSSLRRGFSFSERFVMRLRPADIHRLCKLVLEEATMRRLRGEGDLVPHASLQERMR